MSLNKSKSTKGAQNLEVQCPNLAFKSTNPACNPQSWSRNPPNPGFKGQIPEESDTPIAKILDSMSKSFKILASNRQILSPNRCYKENLGTKREEHLTKTVKGHLGEARNVVKVGVGDTGAHRLALKAMVMLVWSDSWAFTSQRNWELLSRRCC